MELESYVALVYGFLETLETLESLDVALASWSLETLETLDVALVYV